MRTNTEAIVGATARTGKVDYSPASRSPRRSIPTPETHIELVRYPRGSNAMGLLATLLVDGGPALRARSGSSARSRAIRSRSCAASRCGAGRERTIILLVMQTHDNALRLAPAPRPAGQPRSGRRRAESRRYIPVANEAARLPPRRSAAAPASSINEVLLDVPTTAHILGGACVGASPETGVVDACHRVFSDPGLYVVDGSAVSANLGVNPSLTITALAEHALAHWPNKGEPDQRPPL